MPLKQVSVPHNTRRVEQMNGDSKKTSSRLVVSKCGTPQVESLLVESLRVVGGAEATYGSHPWLVRAFLNSILLSTLNKDKQIHREKLVKYHAMPALLSFS